MRPTARRARNTHCASAGPNGMVVSNVPARIDRTTERRSVFVIISIVPPDLRTTPQRQRTSYNRAGRAFARHLTAMARSVLCRLQQEFDLHRIEWELDPAPVVPVDQTGRRKSRHVAVYGLYVATHASRRLTDGNRSSAAQRLQQLPALGGENAPQQLGTGKADAGLACPAAGPHRPCCIGKGLVERAHLKNDRFHGSTS